MIRDDTGVPHPADSGRPAPRRDCIKYYEAFGYLGSSRNWGEAGPNPIAVSEVAAYVTDILGIEDSTTKLKYLRLIQKMDRVELAHIAKKRK